MVKYIFICVAFLSLSKCIHGDLAHPLDPLTDQEIRDTVNIIYAIRPDIQHLETWIFNWITLKEPSKSLLLPYFQDDKSPAFSSDLIPRRSFTVLQEMTTNTLVEVVVNLRKRVVESWTNIPRGTQTTYTVKDNEDGEEIAKKDPGVQERCRQMGWVDMDLVIGETWSAGYVDDRPVLKNAIRPIQVYMYGKLFELDNHFAHPFDFVVTVDLATRKVIAIDNLPTHSDYNADNRNGNECPKTPANFRPELLPANFYRKDVHPIFFSQPNGAGYTIRGNEVLWQKFKFRLGFNMREGLVIHHVSYQDGQHRRTLFYRMSIAEVFVPYGDARPPFHQKFPFDEGEFTLGQGAIDLKEANVCQGGAVSFMSVYLNDERGQPYLMPSVVCIFEEDAGLLWSHLNRDGKVLHVRSTRLTLTMFSNLGNYDYKFSWRLYQDATIEFNTELHGILSTQLLAKDVTNTGGFGTVVAPQINGQFHQHNIALRIDPEVDGNINTVSTVDILPLPDEPSINPYGQGFTTKEKLLTTPVEARTKVSSSTGRSWLIRNPNNIHPHTKKPVSWKLTPFNAPLPFVHPSSPMYPRAAWSDYNVWVTKYKENQLYPAGFYLNASGLPEWVHDDPNADLTHSDVVLWYIYGFTHIPRTEDYPIMPGESSGFFLRPTNFFTNNPGLDVPPGPDASKRENFRKQMLRGQMQYTMHSLTM